MQASIQTNYLKPLLQNFVGIDIAEDCTVSSLTADSRQVTNGSLFFAFPGQQTDGRQYIDQAIAAGACAIIYENRDYQLQSKPSIPTYGITDLNHKQGSIASRFYRHPSRHLLVIGITGTNGKSTCAYLLAQAFGLLGRHCGVLGTLGCGFPGALTASTLTTGDAISNQRHLAEFLALDATAVCMEVSSHGLEQARVSAIDFDIAVFTNLSQDHLDFHGTMASYGAAKKRLFEWPGLTHRVINIDDDFGCELAQAEHAGKCWRYGLREGDIFAEQVLILTDGIELVVNCCGQSYRFKSQLIGHINVANLLAVITSLWAVGEQLQQIQDIFAQLKAPPGRMELFKGGSNQADIVVDYAHTPDALAQALQSLRVHCRGQLSVVFGCGGNRDRDKRSQMGHVAATYADYIVLTNDNPRDENPKKISIDISQSMKIKPTIIHDRWQAIDVAFGQAKKGDIVLIAGKGHETMQTIAGKCLPFSDRSVAAKLTGASYDAFN